VRKSITAVLRSLLLWAAPLGAGASLLLLLASAPYFRSGPGTPTAGDERAWTAMWGALVLTGTGAVVGLASTLTWLALAWRRRRRPRPLEWVRSVANLVLAGAFLWLWFWS
jgi:hypothetical protein